MPTRATNPGMTQPTPGPKMRTKIPSWTDTIAADNAYNFRYKKSRRSYSFVRKIAQSATLNLRPPRHG